MKRPLLLFSFTILLLLFCNIAQAEPYRLAPGDVIGINVWGFEELASKETEIRPDGKISFPLIGEVQAGGLAIQELTNNLTDSLSQYLRDPKVSINIYKYHTIRVYVLGEVHKPGLFELSKQHNLLDAISAAGGYTKDAAKKKVRVLHKDQSGKFETANLVDLFSKADMSQNYLLCDGDIVFLSNNGRIDLARDILPFLSSIYYTKNIID